jgi:hypothetical protein
MIIGSQEALAMLSELSAVFVIPAIRPDLRIQCGFDFGANYIPYIWLIEDRNKGLMQERENLIPFLYFKASTKALTL